MSIETGEGFDESAHGDGKDSRGGLFQEIPPNDCVLHGVVDSSSGSCQIV